MKNEQLKYPDAYALEYHSVIQMMKYLFGWDAKDQQGKARIHGILEAFCKIIKEQGQGTVCLGSTKYVFLFFCSLCLKRHISERYG